MEPVLRCQFALCSIMRPRLSVPVAEDHHFTIALPPPQDGSTPLYRTAQKGLSEVAQLLLRSGKPCVGLLANGTSALHAAAAAGDVAVCGMLLERGADPTVRNKVSDQASAQQSDCMPSNLH